MNHPDNAVFKSILVIAVATTIAALPLTGWSDSHRPSPPTFADFDKDGDGRVSETEFNTLRAERIAANAAEGRQMRGMASAPSFSDVDADGDGFLDEAELTAARKAHMGQMRKQRGEGRGGQHGHHRGGKGMKMPSFEDLDLDGNGCVDPDEFAKHQASHHGQRHGKAPETE